MCSHFPALVELHRKSLRNSGNGQRPGCGVRQSQAEILALPLARYMTLEKRHSHFYSSIKRSQTCYRMRNKISPQNNVLYLCLPTQYFLCWQTELNFLSETGSSLFLIHMVQVGLTLKHTFKGGHRTRPFYSRVYAVTQQWARASGLSP